MEGTGSIKGYSGGAGVFRCGHLKHPFNSSPVGNGTFKCRICYNERLRKYMQARRAKEKQ